MEYLLGWRNGAPASTTTRLTLLTRFSIVDHAYYEGHPPLILAAWEHHDKMVDLLLEHGADPTAIAEEGATVAFARRAQPGTGALQRPQH